jgi:DNA polymerase delta subunit 1
LFFLFSLVFDSLAFSKAKDPLVPFAQERGLQLAGWIRLDESQCFQGPKILTTCKREIWCNYAGVHPALEIGDVVAPIREMAFDIEVFSHDRSFPKPEDPLNVVVQIGLTVKTYGSSSLEARHILHHGPACDAPPGVRVQCFETEHALLTAFAQLVRDIDPDVIYQYNGDNFDWRYLFVRSRLCGADENFRKMSRMRDHLCAIHERKFSSRGQSDNVYQVPEIPGRLNIDVMTVIKRGSEKFHRYNLNTIAQSKLGKSKEDLSIEQLFSYYESGEPAKCGEIAKYCIQDVELTQELVDKLDIVTQLVEMAKLTSTPISDLISRGEGIKSFNAVCLEARRLNALVPEVERDEHAGSFKGAEVTSAFELFCPIAFADCICSRR